MTLTSHPKGTPTPRDGWATADGWTVLFRVQGGFAVEHQDARETRLVFTGKGARVRAFDYLRSENRHVNFDLNDESPAHCPPIERATVIPLY